MWSLFWPPEVHKIPITILPWCQRYDFHRITADVIADRLMNWCRRNTWRWRKGAEICSQNGIDGSMRDALSLLDQCIAFYLGKTDLARKCAWQVLGTVDISVYARLQDGILQMMWRRLSDRRKVVEQGREIYPSSSRILSSIWEIFCWQANKAMHPWSSSFWW